MSSLNRCEFIGNVGKPPEIRSLGQSGDRVANFSVAVNEKWKDKQTGERKESTDWVNLVAFGPLVEVIEKWVNKGDRIFVAGKLRTRKWSDQNGQDRWSTEVVLQGPQSQLIMLGGKSDSQSTGGGGYQDMGEREGPKEDFDLQDDIPFVTATGIF